MSQTTQIGHPRLSLYLWGTFEFIPFLWVPSLNFRHRKGAPAHLQSRIRSLWQRTTDSELASSLPNLTDSQGSKWLRRGDAIYVYCIHSTERVC